MSLLESLEDERVKKLKSLKYGKDRVGGGNSGQPFVTKSVNTAPGNTGGIDYNLRANTVQSVIDDEVRLSNLLFNTTQGIKFLTKQNQLSRIGVKTQASGIINEGTYLQTSTLLQAAGNPFGTHLNKQGVNPFRDTRPSQSESTNIFDRIVNASTPLGLPVYTSKVTSNQPSDLNRLVQLKDNKIAKPVQGELEGFLSNLFGDSLPNILNKINPFKNKIKDVTDTLFGNTEGISPNRNEILRYGGGPGSALGIGQTSLKRVTNTEEGLDFSKYPKNKDKYYVLSGGLISGKTISKENTNISDFRRDLLPQQEGGTGKKNILSKSLNYSDSKKRIEGRVFLGDPGRRDKNTSDYVKGTGNGPLDKINAMPLYKSANVTDAPEKNDLVKFRIGIIQNDNPNEKVYIHFRAFLDDLSDSYTAEWTPQKYMGRGEEFYRYGGFTRSVNLSWTVAAQSKEELMMQYKKLNYLVSSLTPDYTSKGYMAGNLATLTLGGWFYEQPGFITGINLGVPQESPWEIAINNTTGNDKTTKEMPHIVNVTGFNFIPIHEFVPRKNQITPISGEQVESSYGEDPNEYGSERYIALSRGTGKRGDNNYDRKEPLGITLPTTGIQPITPPLPSAPVLTDISQGIN